MSEWHTHGFDPIEVDPLPSVRIKDIHLNDEGCFVMEVSGDIQDAQALAEGLIRDGWSYEEGKWIGP